MRNAGRAREEGWVRGITLVAAAVWAFDLIVLRAGVPDRLDDSWEYGLVARALLEGHGFRTLVIHPPLWTMADGHGMVPVLVHGPLLPVLLAPLLALFGDALLDHVAWLAAGFAVLAAHATARIGSRLGAPSQGALAAAAFTLAPLTLRAVHHDIALTAGAWLLAEALAALLHERPRPTRAALALGLGALVRPEFVLASVPCLLLVRGARVRFIGVFLAVLAPWAWHTAHHAGAPFFNLSSYLVIGYWGARPGIGVMRDFALPPDAWPDALLRQLHTLPAKWLAFTPHAVKRVLSAPSGATGLLALAGLGFSALEARTRRLAPVAALLVLVPAGIMIVTLYDPRYLVPFMPVFALGAAKGLAELTEWMPRGLRRPRAWFGMLVLLMAPSSGPALNDGWREARENARRIVEEREALIALSRSATPTRTVYSDTPDFVAWTTRRPTVWVSREEYERLPDGTSAGPKRPVRRADDLRWFHEQDGRGPVRPSRRPPSDSLETR